MNVVCSTDTVKLDCHSKGILKGKAFARSKSAKVRELTFAYGFSKKNYEKTNFPHWMKEIFSAKKKENEKKKNNNIGAHWDFSRE